MSDQGIRNEQQADPSGIASLFRIRTGLQAEMQSLLAKNEKFVQLVFVFCITLNIFHSN